MRELTLAVVGADFSNADGSNRRSEAMMTLPGERVEFVPEPGNKHDGNAIAVVSPRGVQLGYVNAERAPYIGGRLSRGEEIVAVFQGIEGRSAFIRVRFGGGEPTLPALLAKPGSVRSPRTGRRDPNAFYSDEEKPEFGA